MTCHSAQGTSIKCKITIFDYKYKYVSRKWIWTAITRATNLDNVYFYDYVETDDDYVQQVARTYF